MPIFNKKIAQEFLKTPSNNGRKLQICQFAFKAHEDEMYVILNDGDNAFTVWNNRPLYEPFVLLLDKVILEQRALFVVVVGHQAPFFRPILGDPNTESWTQNYGSMVTPAYLEGQTMSSNDFFSCIEKPQEPVVIKDPEEVVPPVVEKKAKK